jgi:hypothetical protein
MSEYKFGFTGFKTVEKAMGEKKYVVPEGGLKAAIEGWDRFGGIGVDARIKEMLEAFIRWQSENQPHPTDKEFGELIVACRNEIGKDKWENSTEWMRAGMLCHGWLRSMYLAPEPEVPEAVEDLMHKNRKPYTVDCTPEAQDQRILEAYRRGQKSTQQSGR